MAIHHKYITVAAKLQKKHLNDVKKKNIHMPTSKNKQSCCLNPSCINKTSATANVYH